MKPERGRDWRIVGEISLDSATVAFGDQQSLGKNFLLTFDPSFDVDVFDLSERGIPLIGCSTKEDADYPIEMSPAGNALRVEFVTDVGTVEGEWLNAGLLSIGDEGCLVCDPFKEGTVYRSVIEMPPGTYEVQVFEDTVGDILGLRMLLKSSISK